MVNHYARLLDWLRWNTRLDLPCYRRLHCLFVCERSPSKKLGAGSRSTRQTNGGEPRFRRLIVLDSGSEPSCSVSYTCSCFPAPAPGSSWFLRRNCLGDVAVIRDATIAIQRVLSPAPQHRSNSRYWNADRSDWIDATQNSAPASSYPDIIPTSIGDREQ